MSHLFHITEWPFAGLGDPSSLQSEGFVHLCSPHQLLRTAERWYAEQNQVGVLILDEEQLGAELRWEDLYGRGEVFPHLYASLPPRALLGVVRMQRGRDGCFEWPAALRAGCSPLAEGPDEGEAFIEPARRFSKSSLPEVAVLHFFPRAGESLEGLQVTGLGSAIGPKRVLVSEAEGQRFAVVSCGVGAPLAAVCLEELIALGCRRFVACGGAGSLTPEEKLGALVLVSEAWRDEGLSHHYLPASSRVSTQARALEAAGKRLSEWGVAFRQGATWTTDALYRETPARIARRRDQGCLTVEMEAAALLAVAAYRQVPLVPLLVCGDDLGCESWDFRDWTSAHGTHEQALRLAVRLALALA